MEFHSVSYFRKVKNVKGVKHTTRDVFLFYAFDVKNTNKDEYVLLRKATSGVNIQYQTPLASVQPQNSRRQKR